jgi:hypothetical protein
MATKKKAATKNAEPPAKHAPASVKAKKPSKNANAPTREEFNALDAKVSVISSRLGAHGINIPEGTPLDGLTGLPASPNRRSDPVAISNHAQGGHGVLDGSKGSLKPVPVGQEQGTADQEAAQKPARTKRSKKA